MKKALVVLALLLIANLAFAQASPHSVVGYILRFEGTPPPEACVYFDIHFGAHVYDHTSPEFTYDEETGAFFLQITDDLFAVGDTIWVDVIDSCLFERLALIGRFSAGPITDMGVVTLDPISGLRPNLFADFVNPTTGYVTDDFNFGATYYSNPWNRAPGIIGVWIDGTDWFDLTWAGSGTPHYNLGEPYTTTVSGYDIGKGNHTCYFYAEDDFGLPVWTTPLDFTILNTPPTEPEIAIDPVQAFDDENLTVTIITDGGDEDGDVLSYYYDWFRDGEFEGVYSGMGMNVLPSAATAIGELWEVQVYSFDGEAYSADYASALASIIAPVLTDGAVAPFAGDRATEFTYSVTYSNLRDVAPEGVYVSIDGGDLIEMSEVFTRDYIAGAEFQYTTTLGLGEHTFQFSAVDILGHPAVGDVIVHEGPTVGNNVPVIETADLLVDPEPATERSTLTAIPGGWFDADGDPEDYRYEWFVNDIYVAHEGSELDGEYFDKGDEVFCVIIPFDGFDEGEGIATETVVIGNALPDAPGISYFPMPVYDMDDIVVSIEIEAYDPDGDELIYHFEWSIGGEVVGDDSPVLPADETNPGDVVTVRVYANDGDGDGDDVSVEIFIDWPVLSDGAVVPISGAPTEIFRYEVTYTSARNIAPNDVWVNIDGEDFGMLPVDPEDEVFTDGYDFYLETTLPFGDHTYYFTGFDIDGNEAFGEETPRPGPVQGNTLPYITEIGIEPFPTATEADIVQVFAEGADDDDDPVSFLYQWFNLDGAIEGATSDEIDGDYFRKGDLIWCEVIPFDGWEYGLPVNSDQVEIINTAPVIATAHIESDPEGWFNKLAQLVAVVRAGDIDGDELVSSIVWFVNGVEVEPVPVDPFILDGTHFNRGDVVHFEVTVTDDDDASDFMVSDEVEILNAPPQFTEMFIQPNPPFTTDLLDVVVGVDDADGDIVDLAFAWFVDGELIDWAMDFVPAFRTRKHQEWTCVVTADDGMGGIADIDYSVIIRNTPPIVSAVEETIVVYGVNWRTTIRATDPDADRLIWRLIDGPAQIRLDSLTGDISWVDFDDVETLGVHPISILVADGDAVTPVLFNLHVYPMGHELFAPRELDALSGYVLSIPMNWLPPALFGTGLRLPLNFMNYEVYRSNDMTDWTLMGTTPGAGFVDAAVSGGTMYYYRVRAIYEEGTSRWSNIDYATPGTINSNMLYSAFTYDALPIIDGVIDENEWADATEFTVGPQTLYIKNTEDMLYLAFVDGHDNSLDPDDAFYVEIDDNRNLRWPAFGGSNEGEYRVKALTDFGSESTFQGIWGTYPGSIGRDERGPYPQVEGAVAGGDGDPVVYELAIEINNDPSVLAAINSAMGNIIGFRFAAWDAGLLSWTREWLLSTDATDPESFGGLMLGVGVGGPNFSVWRNFYEVTLLEGHIGTRPMWVSNLGNGRIDYDLYESYLPIWAGVTRDAHAPILLYTSDLTLGADALNFLGYPYDVVTTTADFLEAISTVGYDAVVVTLNDALTAAELAMIQAFLRDGGKAIITCPDLESRASHTIWPYVGMEIFADLGSTPSALTWDRPEHPIFNTPLAVPFSVETVEETFPDYGDAILATSGTVLASFDEFPYPANGAITLSVDENLILNSFVMSDSRDENGNGMADGLELLINELYYLVALDDIPWLSVSPTSGTLSSHETDDAVLTFDATHLTEGDYRGFIIATSTDPRRPVITVPCLLHVRAPSYNLVTLAFPEELQRVQPGQRITLPLTVNGAAEAGVRTISMTVSTNEAVISPDVIHCAHDILVTDYDLDHITFQITTDFVIPDGILCEIEFVVAELAAISSISNIVISDVSYNEDSYVEEIATVDGRVMVEAGEMDWAVWLRFTHGFNEKRLYFGVNPLGTDLYDLGLDQLNVPPGSWLNPFSDVALLDPDNPRLDGDIRSAYDDEVMWFIPVGDSAGKVEWSFRDEDTLAVMGSLFLNGDIDMKTSTVYFYEPNETLEIVYRRTGEGPFDFYLYPGWNMVSLPIIPIGRGNTPREIFPTGEQFYYFDSQIQSWVAATTIEPGIGYVVLSYVESHYRLWGKPVEGYTYNLFRGWNLIGSAYNRINFSSPTTNPPGAIFGAPDHAFWYDALSANYISSNELIPGRGYFVASNLAALLSVPGVAGYKAVLPREEFKAEIRLDFGGDVEILGVGKANIAHISPIPPMIGGMSRGAFLAVDGWSVSEALFAEDVNCHLSINRPAKISVANLPEGVMIYLDNEPISASDQIFPGVYKLSFGILPKRFALYQNAPNPFNPTTAITFDIPAKADVQLEVYDLLGRRVNMLVNDEMTAGSYRVTWDGKDESGREVPSGIYFYRIKAGDDVANRRMLLIK
jgi:hypothetical protein